MKPPRVRIATLMLLVVIAALAVALVVEKRRAGRAERALLQERQKLASAADTIRRLQAPMLPATTPPTPQAGGR